MFNITFGTRLQIRDSEGKEVRMGDYIVDSFNNRWKVLYNIKHAKFGGWCEDIDYWNMDVLQSNFKIVEEVKIG